MDEIERKFLIKKLPDLSDQTPILYERYYLRRGDDVEDRIQLKGGKYEREILESVSSLARKKHKTTLTKGEFESLKQQASEVIIREGYQIKDIPNGTIKIYHGRFEGLIRAEVEFPSEEKAQAFKAPDWFGKEISDTPLSRDSRLLDLSDEDFKKLLSKNFQ
ncbi:hypothetical protein A2631_03405 [Candidatus Daviesbacteria bacterium RIFCSPHIGHO2_01_FULL_44_29]|uniref:CYTH domain-containing protein n=1 Tax=Candidatus Daviesbacteria bacterium RIFCSPHIGHO2_02_FULL_43_12 TaxID=1797776 RepID=A0A1F5KFL8_9BACT|nr:MAG: hypothetical protein A2631_03405 [Candidatus Daviesbacteria bacterium RIFCSPHIGHO2_01_FULL_44_29]OGE38855.1 MAG: hypothetical protein A3E86_02980 [Candidatus Daviesbacteria bacterium RIFCSPHIGHO2_12_FULL_47_45]OGE39752.1 MAG: hypothetical protein A3D25_03420 [Candidatus Daviesbacteria bacterium RIFCSPHIGHO2_02_FULL_43_12]OGE69957.1 MAG: hypothetical protein A3B55_04670 [Candidatus Daviesbacteria bacterium RIFCSPLOWO2_01_FULL_43_15]